MHVTLIISLHKFIGFEFQYQRLLSDIDNSLELFQMMVVFVSVISFLFFLRIFISLLTLLICSWMLSTLSIRAFRILIIVVLNSKSDNPTSLPCLLLFFLIYKFIYFWLHCIIVAVCGLSLVVASRSYSSLRCVCFSLWWLLLLRSMGSRHTGFSSCGTRAQ